MSPAARKRLAALALGALAAVSVVTAFCHRDSSKTSTTSDREAVAAVLKSKRLVEPRLSVGSRYTPAAELSTKPRDVLQAEEERELLRAADSIRRDDQPLDPESHHTAGLLHLALGETDRSIASLHRAAAGAPRDGEVFSDLAAAYLVRAAEQDRPIDLAAALEYAERAVELSPDSPKTLFNRALARQRLSLTGGAIEAWQEYLHHETDPGWTREAKSAMDRLQTLAVQELWNAAKPRLRQAISTGDQATVLALVRRFRQQAREMGENESLAAWAELSRQGNLSGAAAELSMARAVGDALTRLSGDALLADTVADIDAALKNDPQRLRTLIDGVLAYREGFLLLGQRKFAKAEVPLERASRTLQQAASPFAAWADFGLVRCAYQRPKYPQAQRLALDLLSRLEPRRHPVLVGRARVVLGSSLLASAKPAEALESHRLALEAFERSRDSILLASTHSQLANTYNQLGDTAAAWQHRDRALRGFSEHRDEERLRVTLSNLAVGSMEAEYVRAALAVQSEAVRLARRQGDAEQLANSLLNRSSILARSGLGEPENDLEEAHQNVDLIEDSSIRESILADLLTVEGHALQRQDPPRALAALDRAIEMYRRDGRLVMMAPALHTRAAVQQRLGRNDVAEHDLRVAIEALEEERGSVSDAEHRASFLGRSAAAAVFDAMIRLQADRGRADLALEYAERRRARLLLDWLSALPKKIEAKGFRVDSWTRPQPLPELQEQIPEGVAVVAHELLPDRLLLWVIRRDTLHMRHARIPQDRAEALARRLKSATHGPEHRLQPVSAALYQSLIAPIDPLLREGETVVFVPESPLDSIPFGLLFDARRKRYLIEERPVAVAPSLNLFIRLTQKDRAESFADADVLVIADPAFDRSRHPDLKSLPGTLEEARVIQSLFARADIVPEQEARRERLLDGMGRHRVLHFGGHTLVNSAKPLLSSLLLAPGPKAGDSGVLYAREIIGSPDGDTDLVVLSSCRSAGGAEIPAEGVGGLVWPFFSRGASIVIASTREVEDGEAARLFISFYRHLAAGTPPGSALRKAQLEMLAANRSTGRRSFDWAVFQVYGAVPGSDTFEKGEKR